MSESIRKKTQVMIVEDHVAVRQATAFFLDREPEFEVVAQAGTLAEARRLFTQAIEVAIVDLALPDGNGIEFVKYLREFNPEATVLVMTASATPEIALEAGASATLHKSADMPEIVETLRWLRAG